MKPISFPAAGILLGFSSAGYAKGEKKSRQNFSHLRGVGCWPRPDLARPHGSLRTSWQQRDIEVDAPREEGREEEVIAVLRLLFLRLTL